MSRLALLYLVLLPVCAHSFSISSRDMMRASITTPSSRRRSWSANSATTPGTAVRANGNKDSDFPEEELTSDYTGSVDWDAEWKKVMEEQKSITTKKTKSRPGSDFYKSDAEIAAIKASNKMSRQMGEIAKKVPSVPSWNSVKSDWKFWIGVLAVISIGTSLLAAQAPPTLPNNASPDSYYI